MDYKRNRYQVALYKRLSREDGDRVESDSIINQQHLLADYCARDSDLEIVKEYADDGYTGTNFNRPAFNEMLKDIEAGIVNCVIVKDLSRFGRDYIDMGYYLERWFPSHGVRFIAVNDNVDSLKGPYDIMLPLKNVFNAQYAKDISQKVKSAFKAKQQRGEFVGAFASYGYMKDPANHNHLVVDPVASKTVVRIFTLAAQGVGQLKIAKLLNKEGIPCPSEYKKIMGERYRNNRKLDSTTYWTYATIHRLLANAMYLGTMVQARIIRTEMHGKAVAARKENWITVKETHEPIITKELWDSAQAQLNQNARSLDFDQKLGLFAGFLRCGDCGRAMTKTRNQNTIYYSCGSYKRYGPSVCSKHRVDEQFLAQIVLKDINRMIAAVTDLKKLVDEQGGSDSLQERREGEQKRLEGALERIQRLKKNSYEDYQDNLLSRDEFIRYKQDYDQQEQSLQHQIEELNTQDSPDELLNQPWAQQLCRLGRLTELDRATVAQTVKEIRIYDNRRIEITYLFSKDLEPLLAQTDGPDSHP